MPTPDAPDSRRTDADSSTTPTSPSGRRLGDDADQAPLASPHQDDGATAIDVDDLLRELDDHLQRAEHSVHALHTVSTTLFGVSPQAHENRAMMAARSHLSRTRFEQLVVRYETLRADFQRLRDEMPAENGGSARRAEPAVITRAIAYMQAHLSERADASTDGYAAANLTTAEIAAASRVGPRALQQAFRRYRGTTPTGYLRDLRYQRAHHDLQTADATHGDTVAAIAARWGFTHLSHFSTGYRHRFGQTPRQTLKT